MKVGTLMNHAVIAADVSESVHEVAARMRKAGSPDDEVSAAAFRMLELGSGTCRWWRPGSWWG